MERVVPGNRISVMGIYSIKKVIQGKAKRVLYISSHKLVLNLYLHCILGSTRENQCGYSSAILEGGRYTSGDRRSQQSWCE